MPSAGADWAVRAGSATRIARKRVPLPIVPMDAPRIPSLSHATLYVGHSKGLILTRLLSSDTQSYELRPGAEALRGG